MSEEPYEPWCSNRHIEVRRTYLPPAIPLSETGTIVKRPDPPDQIITNDNWIFNMKITSELKSIEDQSLGQMSNE